MSLTGRTLGGRYKLLGLLGSGGMGAVYEAEQVDLRRRVAVKVLHGAGDREVASEDFLRFKQEALAAAGLGHPNIVQIIDYEEGGGKEPPFLVMELLRGTSLSALVKSEKRLDPGRAVSIVVQILSALGAAHDARIVHRDIKPENVFVCSTSPLYELVKVLDFGLARPLDDQNRLARTRVGFVMGTPAYMAPEQARGAAADVRMDLFAVGVTLYYALAGRRPFEGPTTSALLQAIRRQPPLPLDSLRPELDLGLVRVVEKSLSKDPEQRFATARDFVEALAPYWPQRTASGSQDAVVPARPPATSTKQERRAARSDVRTAGGPRAHDTDEEPPPRLAFASVWPAIAPGMVRLARFAPDGRSALAIGPAGLARWVEGEGWGARPLPRGWKAAEVRGFAFGPNGEALLFAEGGKAEFRVAGGGFEPFMHGAEIATSAAHVDDISTVALAGVDTRLASVTGSAAGAAMAGDAVVVERTRTDRRAYPIAARRVLFDVTRAAGTLVACGEKGAFCLIASGRVHARVLGQATWRAVAPLDGGGVVAVGDDGAFVRLERATPEHLATAAPLRVGVDDLFLVRAAGDVVCALGRSHNVYVSIAGGPVEAIAVDLHAPVRAAALGSGVLRLALDDASIVEAPL
ncbi:MAG TPA: serine/threonine-protein kinase [Polyangiaceae bacterium]|nr:serine/threonine-protein kinase [Polyangiaceae bacterium]